MTDTETLNETIDVEYELLDHLAVPESVMRLHKERLTTDMLDRSSEYNHHRKVYEWVMAYVDKHKKAPPVSAIKEEFEHDFEEVAWPVDHVIEKLRERYLRNQVGDIAMRMSRKVLESPKTAATTAYSDLQDVIAKTARVGAAINNQEWHSVLNQHEHQEEGQGFTFGWADVDTRLGGIKPGGLYFIIARPKRYKSWCLLKSAVEAAKDGATVAFFSLEMSEIEMTHRAMCMWSGAPWSAFRDNSLSPTWYEEMRFAFDQIADEDLLHILRPPVGERSTMHLLDSAAQVEADFIVIDQLKFVESPRANRSDARWQQVEYVCEDLKEASHTLPIYIAAQFNREAANLTEMGDLSKIGLSDSIGQTADMLLGLHQTPQMRENRVIQFGTIDSRAYEHSLWLLHTTLEDRNQKGYLPLGHREES